jgi:hypothetical protein
VTFWILLWKVVLVAALAVFACMTVCVTLGGAVDIRRLFERLRQDHQKWDRDI